MPTYSYTCKDCGVNQDIVQSMSDPTLTVCPTCGGHLRKLFNNVGVVFKGSGFYRNDARTKPDSSSPGDSAKKTADTTTAAAASGSGSTSSSSSTGDSSPSPAKKSEASSKPAPAPKAS
ncbi:MAG: FmdB family zinc ribbon protein [Candidatus Nanopelagicales bacterium]